MLCFVVSFFVVFNFYHGKENDTSESIASAMAYHVGEAKRLKLLYKKALKREAVGESGCNKEATVSLYFITQTGKSYTIRMTLNLSLAKAKEMVHAATGIPVKDQRIVFGKHELTNGRLHMATHGVSNLVEFNILLWFLLFVYLYLVVFSFVLFKFL
jgi:hypothetical protein